jgi:DNA-binding HxlR family transcriptional regulator/peroxiredoxin
VRRADLSGDECAIAQALDVVGDWWTLLVVRELARGRCRFEELCDGLGASRKVVSQRLKLLVDHDVIRKECYSEHPPRYEYHLTGAGLGLLPVLVTLQDWGATWVLGDGTLSATAADESTEAQRVRRLVGVPVPRLHLVSANGEARDPVAASDRTILFCYPGTAVPGVVAHPPGWADIPGAAGCTLEAITFRDHLSAFVERDATIVGVSTQRPDEQSGFAAANDVPFGLLSDVDLQLTAALRLPTFRAGGMTRLKRITLVIDRNRVIREVLYPIADPAGSVFDAIDLLDRAPPSRRHRRRRRDSEPTATVDWPVRGAGVVHC